MNLPSQYSQMRSESPPGYGRDHADRRAFQAGINAAARTEDAERQGMTAAQRMQEDMVRTAADQGYRMNTAARYVQGEAAQAPQPLMDPAQRLLAGFKHERVYHLLPEQGERIAALGNELFGGRAVGELGLALRGLT